MTQKKKICLCFLLIVFFFLFNVDNITASIRVSEGLSRDFTLSHGEVISARITIRNLASESQEVAVYLRDYFYTHEGITQYKEPGTTYRSNADWIRLNPAESIIIPPQSEADLHYTITVPQDSILQGTYWSMLMIEPQEGVGIVFDSELEMQTQTGIRQRSRYGIQIRTHLGETGTTELTILDRRLIQDSAGEKYLEFDLQNVGERFFEIDIFAEFYNEEGLLEQKVDGPSARLLPGTSVRRSIKLADLKPARYQVLIIFDGERDKVWGARYNLNLE